jgi:hypothetical protein
MTESTKTIHFAYIVAILLAIIIGLMTVEWGGIHDIVAYFGFALTLSSLVLALLAIVYSYFSNASFGQNISTLNAASREMSQSAAEIKTATEALRSRVDEIPEALNAMGMRVEETKGAVLTLTERTAAWTTPPASKGETAGDTPSERFLDQSPLAGLMVLYAATRAAALKRPLQLNKFEKRIGIPSYDYMFAFLLGAEIAGVVEKDNTWKGPGIAIARVDPIIQAGVRDRITRVAEDIEKELISPRPKGSPSMTQSMRETVAAVDRFVEGGSSEEPATTVPLPSALQGSPAPPTTPHS